MKRTSPAPMSTPSRANTTPARGCMTTNQGQAMQRLGRAPPGRARTAPGSTQAPAPIDAPRSASPQTRADARDPGRRVPGPAAVSPAPRVAPTSDWAAIATASRASAQNIHSCSAIWCAPSGGRAEAGRHRGRREEADLERGAPDQQVAADHELAPQHGRPRGQRHPLATSARTNSTPPMAWATDVGDRRADQAQPDRVDQQRAEQGGDHVGGEHVAHRAAGVLHAAHPAVAGHREQDAGRAERRRSAATAPRPWATSPSPPASGAGQRPGDELGQRRPRAGADDERDPGRLHALGDGLAPLAGAEAAGGAAGRAVGQHGAEPGGDGQHAAAEREPGQLGPARGGRPRRCRPARRSARPRGPPAPAAPARQWRGPRPRTEPRRSGRLRPLREETGGAVSDTPASSHNVRDSARTGRYGARRNDPVLPATVHRLLQGLLRGLPRLGVLRPGLRGGLGLVVHRDNLRSRRHRGTRHAWFFVRKNRDEGPGSPAMTDAILLGDAGRGDVRRLRVVRGGIRRSAGASAKAPLRAAG